MKLNYIKRLAECAERALTQSNSRLGYSRTVDTLTRLAVAVHEYEGESEDMWFMETRFGLGVDALIVGAHWHSAHWHGGQNSQVYALLSATGKVFSPGMSSEPEPGSAESDVFESLAELASE